MPAPPPAAFPFITPSTSTSNSNTPHPQQPAGWTNPMTQFVRQCLQRGECAGSTLLLLETEFPQLRRKKITKEWVVEVGKKGVWGAEEV